MQSVYYQLFPEFKLVSVTSQTHNPTFWPYFVGKTVLKVKKSHVLTLFRGENGTRGQIYHELLRKRGETGREEVQTVAV